MVSMATISKMVYYFLKREAQFQTAVFLNLLLRIDNGSLCAVVLLGTQIHYYVGYVGVLCIL